MSALVRWVPTNRMLADGLTKDAGDLTDLLRACMRRATYQISPESTVLEIKAAEKQLRKQMQQQRQQSPEGLSTPDGEII